MIRWTLFGLLFGLLAAGVLYDRVERTPDPPAPPEFARLTTPALADPAHLTTDWYCPVGALAEASTLVVTNLSDEAAVGTIEVMTTEGPGSGLRFDLNPMETEFIALAELDTSGLAAGALVEVVGGEAVVGHRIGTAQGFIEGPCSTATSDEWFFAAGSTTRDSSELVALLNPSYDDVVFRAEFQTAGRLRQPLDLKAAVVPARSIRVLNIGDYVAREALVSTHIEVVTGRLAVERLTVLDGTLGPVGASLNLGVADTATTWNLVAGRIHEGATSTLTVSNPSEASAEVDIYLQPMDPNDRAIYGLVPEELTIAPGRTAQIDLNDLAARVGLPLPYEVGVRVVSANGVGVVAERWSLSPPIDESLIGAGGTNARVVRRFQEGDDVAEEDLPSATLPDFVLLQPTADTGITLSRGVEQYSNRWVFPIIGFPEGGVTAVVVQALDSDATINVSTLVGGALQPPVQGTVLAEGRTLIPITSPAGMATVVVTSDAPVAVEGLVVVPGQSASTVAAVPTIVE